MLKFKFVIILFVSVVSFGISLACDGHRLNIKQLKNCKNSDSTIKIAKNFTIKMTKDCFLILNGCIDTGAFQSAKAKFTISKNGMVLLQSKENVCELMDKSGKRVKSIMTSFGIPEKCPVPQSHICSDESKKIDIKKLKKFFSVARGGAMKINAEIKHDTGNTCARLEFELKKVD